MAENWADNVKKYVADADDAVIAAIVRYCGIALRNRDSSLVSMSDPTETGRVRENFLKKKLGLTHTDEELDAGIQAVGQRMKGENFKNRVTVYYLLLEHFGEMAKFGGVAKAAGAVAGAGAAAAGAVGLASLGGSSNDAPAKADDADAASATGSVKDAAASVTEKAGDAAGAVAGAAGAAVAGVAGAAAAAGGLAKDAASSAADVVGDAAGAVTGAAGAAVAGAAGVAAAAGGLAKDAASSAVGDAAGAVTGAAGAALAGVTGAASSTVNALTGGGGDGHSGYAADDGEGGGSKWLLWLLLLALLAFLAWWLLAGPHGCSNRDAGMTPAEPAAAASTAAAPALPAALASAPAEGQVTIPSGAGVTTEMRDGKPVVKVYFATGKTDVVPDFAPAAAALKDYLAANAGSTLQVSGYNDPTGNAALNAELSKKRAQAVKADLVKAGIGDETVALVKPENTTDATVDKAAARRVEVTVK
ncbi:MAG: DUF2853 family protein [Sphingomonadales bacterium]|nr:DUF2853 family protein [Sphingomonadales bacterium]